VISKNSLFFFDDLFEKREELLLSEGEEDEDDSLEASLSTGVLVEAVTNFCCSFQLLVMKVIRSCPLSLTRSRKCQKRRKTSTFELGITSNNCKLPPFTSRPFSSCIDG